MRCPSGDQEGLEMAPTPFTASERVTEQLGMSPGDVIVQINRTPVTSAEDVSRALDYYAGRGAIRVFFEHEGSIYPTDFFIR